MNKRINLGTTNREEIWPGSKFHNCDVITLPIYLHCDVIKAPSDKPGLFAASQISNRYLETLGSAIRLLVCEILADVFLDFML